jgi:BirA family biotin operon repressor/biotin-[acetyl-CoA-carboxylase] ligase
LTDPATNAQIPLMTGVAVAETLSRYCPGEVTLKWPNDVQIRGKKVCGILTEMKTAKDPRINFVVVGIGININIMKEDFDESFRDIATSLKEETGKDISRLDFTVEFLEYFEKWYRTWLKTGFEPVREAWLAYSSMVGRQVQVVFQGDVRKGSVHGIDHTGAMLLEDENGIIKKIMAGDATLIRH